MKFLFGICLLAGSISGLDQIKKDFYEMLGQEETGKIEKLKSERPMIEEDIRTTFNEMCK